MFENISEFKIIIIISGLFMLFLGIAFVIYFKLISRNNESFRATITGFRKMTSRSCDNTKCPSVEFDFNGSIVTSYYYRYMFENEIDFDIGDTFTILVNPKMPKTFRFENDKNPYSVKSCIIMAASGLVALIIGVII